MRIQIRLSLAFISVSMEFLLRFLYFEGSIMPIISDLTRQNQYFNYQKLPVMLASNDEKHR